MVANRIESGCNQLQPPPLTERGFLHKRIYGIGEQRSLQQRHHVNDQIMRLRKEGTVYTESLDKSYDVENEVKFLQSHKNLTEEQKEYYVNQSLVSFWSEFAHKVPYKALSGIYKPDKNEFELCGVDMRKMYKKSTELAGPDSREQYEEFGLETIFNNLQKDDIAFWVSSPKIADYGFVMIFLKGEYSSQLGGYPMKELLIRYDENLGSIEKSKQIYKLIEQATQQPASVANLMQTYKEFLASPITGDSTKLQGTDTLLKSLGISEKIMKDSEYFEEVAEKELQPLIKEYYRLVNQMAGGNISTRDYQQSLQRAKEYRDIMFLAAQDISQQLQDYHDTGKKITSFNFSKDDTTLLYMQALRVKQDRAAVIAGGSNCSVTLRQNGLTMNIVAELLEKGNTLEQIIHTGGETAEFYGAYKCPSCEQYISGERKDGHDWKTHCPHCGSNEISCKKKVND